MMVMKTSFVCLLLIVYMGTFYYANKHLPIKSTRIFSYYFVSATIVTLFDFITLYTVNHMDTVPVFINTAAHVIYMLAINTTVFLYFLYLRSLLENQLNIPRMLRLIQSVPFIATIILVPFLPLGYIQGVYTNYSMGSKVYALYASVILYNFFILYYCIRYWKLLNREKRAAIMASVPIFFCISVLNITVHEALGTIVYIVLSAAGLMLSNENSEKYLDKQTGMFNQYALGIVCNEYIHLKKSIFVVVMTISESENLREAMDWRQYITVMEQIQCFCKKVLKRQTYCVGDNGFVLLVHSNQLAEKTAESIAEYASTGCSSNISFSHRIIPLNECESSDELMSKILEICINAINKMAAYDFLTGVYNRNSFEKELEYIKSNGINAYYLVADLNNLKETNDNRGHSVGDELLQAVARLFKDTVGKSGMVFRQGGDEFAILWRGEDVGTLLELLEKNRAELNQNREVPVDYAIGYGKILEEEGMRKADKMMYENKFKMKSVKR